MERDLAEGQHRNPRPDERPEWFTTAFLYHPTELAGEVADAGFSTVELFGIEGPGWVLNASWEDTAVREQVLYAARAAEREPARLGLSPHILAVARPRLGQP